MATNKNQHFVPRCYLKEFTHNSENKAINVFNIDRNRCIPLTPVKNQCSKDYFYGQDERLEKAIQLVESSYATTLREIISGAKNLSENQILVLKRFWLLQYLRTEASSRRAVEMTNSSAKIAGIPDGEFNIGIKDAVLMAMRTYADRMDIVDDLKMCLIFNKTNIPFITSDDPAVLTNRWHLNDVRTKFRSFGLTTSGTMLLLPLTPKILCVGYDGDVYSISHKKGWASISNQNDIKAFNQHQFLNCRANVFFKSMDSGSLVSESFNEISGNRLPERFRINYAILDYVEGEHTRYKVVDPENAEEHEEAILHSETLHYRPTIWPITIRWRNKGTVYTNGTGVGYLRKHHILSEHRGFHKESTKFIKKPKSGKG